MRTITAIPAAAAALALSLAARPAHACGGFFCSQTPVIQTAERIVFAFEDAKPVAYIQLQYSGDDPNFAWIIPVTEPPVVEVGVGQAMFDALEAETQPVFVGGAVPAPFAEAAGGAMACGGDGGGPSGGLSARYIPMPEVTVFQNASVGPYEYVTLAAETAFDLNTWLLINGYRAIPGSDAIVQQYLDEGMKLLALRLAPEVGSTAIEPIKLTYPSGVGCTIPIRLTAIASSLALDIVVWVFGDGRASPVNYAHTAIEPANVRGPFDYLNEVGRAIDGAGGHAFITEMARPTAFLDARGDPTLEKLFAGSSYVTRLRSQLDPEEMTLDPELMTAPGGEDVSPEVVIGGRASLGGGSMVAVLAIGLYVWRRRRS